MSNSGLFERKHEDCDNHLTAIKAEVQKLWDRTVVHVQQAMEARRYQDGHSDPDYGRRLRELEGQIEQIDREQQGFRMTGNYNEGGEKKSWKDYILGLLALVIIGWLARLDVKIDDISDLKAQAKQMENRQNLTDKHLESTDTHVERIENKVYRGAP